MGKTRKDLENQLKMEAYKEDAKKCIKIYNKLLEIFDGYVWASDYDVLVATHYIGKYPNAIRIQKPTKIGEIFWEGLNK